MSTLHLRSRAADLYVPDATDIAKAVRRTTHLAVGAHQDDIPIMAYDGIRRCAGHNDRWFSAVTVTNGAASPRTGPYADYSDEQMTATRVKEERQAAVIGGYSIAIQLGYPSAETRDTAAAQVIADLSEIIALAKPETVYTHSPTDKHDTHVATALRAIAAIRRLPSEQRPRELYGCEVWRGLDWLVDEDKISFDYTGVQGLFSDLMSAYASQIVGGKRYDIATTGRWLANATFLESHRIEPTDSVGFAVDLSPLIQDEDLDIGEYVSRYLARLGDDVAARIMRLG